MDSRSSGYNKPYRLISDDKNGSGINLRLPHRLPSPDGTHGQRRIMNEDAGELNAKYLVVEVPINSVDFLPKGLATNEQRGFIPPISTNPSDYLGGDNAFHPLPSGGDVFGPASAVDGSIAVYDGVTGKKIKDGGVLLSDLGSKIEVANTKIQIIDSGVGYASVYIDGAERYRLTEAGISDANGNEILKVQKTASAVNFIFAQNAATTGKPQIGSDGDDANVGLEIVTKGTGQVDICPGGAQRLYAGASEAGTNSADFNIDGVLKIGGIQVLQGREAAIADIADTSGPANDGVCRAMCNAILALLRTQGIIET